MAVAPRNIDPSGLADPVDPSVVGGAADASPTTLVLQYLKQRGYQPSSENVRRALEANQRDPGVIPGLRSDRPATDAEDQAAMRGAGAGRGRSLSVPPESGAPRGATPPMDRRDDQTSAAPTSDTTSAPPPVPPTADYNMPGWGTAAAGTGVALANAILNRTPSAQFVGNAQMPSGRVTDVPLPPAPALPGPKPMDLGIPGQVINPALPPPTPAIAAPSAAPEAPVAAPGSVITPPTEPPLPFNSASPRRPPTPAEMEAVARAARTSPTLRALGNAARVIPR